MVSLRRRRLLGYSTGIASSEIELPRSRDIGSESQNPIQDGKSVSVHPTPSSDLQPPKEGSDSKITGSSNVSGTSSSKEEQDQYIAGPEIKRRKRHRRKHLPDHEPCTMRGVYYKNLKWQAAIKVDKKQIHLGTVATQEEAAHLYDRAAFMCGREPNFGLPEEEQQELRKVNWEEFLARTRSAIMTRKYQRRMIAGLKQQERDWQNGDDTEQSQGGVTASEDAEPKLAFKGEELNAASCWLRLDCII